VLNVLPATPISEASCHCSGIFVTYITSPALVETEERINDHPPANDALLRLCFSKLLALSQSRHFSSMAKLGFVKMTSLKRARAKIF
jgi:hypothetical protein